VLWYCLLLPSLPLDVFARAQSPDDPRPLAVTTGGHYPRIVSANAAAGAAGIVPDQLVSAALALAPEVVLRDRDPAAEATALASFAAWVTQFTPMVSLSPPDALVAEISGSLRLFGGLPRLAARLAQGARDLGYTVRPAQAPTPAAALMFARARNDAAKAREGAPSDAGKSAVQQANRQGSFERISFADALARLPLAYLDVAPDILATLAGAGITSFGEACALPRDGLARRVGGDFVIELDRVRGLAADPRLPFVPPPVYQGALTLPAPVDDVEALAFATNRLVHELAGWLQGRGLGVSEIALSLAHERYVGLRTGVPATAVRFALAAPAREPAHLVAVLRERLARVVLPAPVEAIALASVATAPLASRNFGLLPGDEPAVAVPLQDRLRARLGDDAVSRLAPRAEHRPERASDSAAAFAPSTPAGARARKSLPSAPPLPDAPRPVWLLAEPEPLGHLQAVQPWVLQDGPERIESGWWDGLDVRRDYFVAQNPRGETVWIYRDHRYGIDDGEWFLHGVFA
jgi:protein ImuB